MPLRALDNDNTNNVNSITPLTCAQTSDKGHAQTIRTYSVIASDPPADYKPGAALVCLLVGAQNFHNRLECKPLWDVLTATQHLAELGPRKVLAGQTLGLSYVRGDVPLLLCIAQVQRRHRLHSHLGGLGLGQVLGIVCAVEVLAVKARLRASHVAPDDEVGASVVLADDHVLDGFTGSCHVHGVRQVGPENLGVGRLLLQHLVRLVAHCTGDVISLGGAAGGVHEDHGPVAHVVGVKRAGEELVVRAVHGVAALERHHVHAGG
mmetsp:Transcript_22925/g.43643  ORF Transcript_22925/g.43643 Transcript_22925/m.43643 type:complete len:264 (+) Transcript_22925:71-862(+)